MTNTPPDSYRRHFLGTAALALAALPFATRAGTTSAVPGTHTSLGPLKQVDAGVLSIGYAEAGPADGPVVILLHGWPYDIISYVDVAPLLAARGYRVIVPYLRGFGTTRFLSGATPRTAQQYDDMERRLAAAPGITIPTITLEGDANGAPHQPETAYAGKFKGRYLHRRVSGGIGHNLPQEAPEAFAQAVVDVDRMVV
ncbi:hypothetical protein KX816_15660 [Sphingosinicellaceae bacterium]|nr:hypothetical protein KX816_15660 [Sphingosinicellaceae bacterium]